MPQTADLDEIYQRIGKRLVELMRQKSLPLSFAAKGSKKKAKPNCTPGKSWSCGYTCLPLSKKNCKSALAGQSATYADYLSKQVAGAKPSPPAKPKQTKKTKSSSASKSNVDHDAIKKTIPADQHIFYDLANGLIRPTDVKLSDAELQGARDYMASRGVQSKHSWIKEKVGKIKKEESSITEDEALGLSTWISNNYGPMNKAIYNPGAVKDREDVMTVNVLAASALHKLQPVKADHVAKQAQEKGEDFDPGKPLERHMDIADPVAFVKRYQEALKGDGIIRENTFFATTHLVSDTSGIDWVKNTSNLTYRVKPKLDGTGQGRYVDHFKGSQSEGEILYPPQSRFKVVAVTTPPPFTGKLSAEAAAAEKAYMSAYLLQKIYGSKWKSKYEKQNGIKAPTAAQLTKLQDIMDAGYAQLVKDEKAHKAKYGNRTIIDMEEI